MACPWDGWNPIALGFCEEILCSWIKQPGNTWSNIGYLGVAIWIWKRARTDQCLVLRLLAVASLVTAFGSAFFHASGTAFAGTGDYLGMFLESGAMTALNFRRWTNARWRWVYVVFPLTTITLLGSAHLFPSAERWIYAFGSPCYLIEIRLFFLYGKSTRYRYFLLSWTLVAIALVFWWLDESKILCFPGNHWLPGHGLWHLFSAASLAALYLYYHQFAALADEGSP